MESFFVIKKYVVDFFAREHIRAFFFPGSTLIVFLVYCTDSFLTKKGGWVQFFCVFASILFVVLILAGIYEDVLAAAIGSMIILGVAITYNHL